MIDFLTIFADSILLPGDCHSLVQSIYNFSDKLLTQKKQSTEDISYLKVMSVKYETIFLMSFVKKK